MAVSLLYISPCLSRTIALLSSLTGLQPFLSWNTASLLSCPEKITLIAQGKGVTRSDRSTIHGTTWDVPLVQLRGGEHRKVRLKRRRNQQVTLANVCSALLIQSYLFKPGGSGWWWLHGTSVCDVSMASQILQKEETPNNPKLKLQCSGPNWCWPTSAASTAQRLLLQSTSTAQELTGEMLANLVTSALQ